MIAEAIQQARIAMSKNDFEASQRLINDALQSEPDNFEARYTLAVLYRAQGQHHDAKKLLITLLTEQPEFGRGFQELGFCELALKREPSAIQAFQQAVEADGSLIDSWRVLVTGYERSNDPRAEQATQQLDFLTALPNELRTVISYLSANRLGDAERPCLYFIQHIKTHI